MRQQQLQLDVNPVLEASLNHTVAELDPYRARQDTLVPPQIQSLPLSWANSLTCRIPGTHDDPPVVGVGPDGLDDLGQLVHPLPCIVSVHVHIVSPEMSPLEPIHRTQITWNGIETSLEVSQLLQDT